MTVLEKDKVIDFLKDLTEVTRKHNIIITQDFDKIIPTMDSGLQIGFNVNIQEYSAYQGMSIILIPRPALEQEVIEDAEIIEETKDETTTEPVAEAKSEEPATTDDSSEVKD